MEGMKILSLRQFRERAAELTESVQIAIRDRSGNLRILGFYTPYTTEPVPQILDLGAGVSPEAVETVRAGISAGTIKTAEEAGAVARTIRPARSFPKSAQLGRKKQ